MKNLIDAIISIINDRSHKVTADFIIRNRANAAGQALETYIKEAFAGILSSSMSENEKLEKIAEVFSYLGNNSNPPDAMLRGGDAIEIKKIESLDASLALNSSYPKDKLYRDSPMISQDCRNAENNWTEKDMIFAVGCVKNNQLKYLFFVYGADYCARKETYERIKNIIKEGVESTEGIELANTNELGRVNRVDPLGITYLRVRGMWHIENPCKVFNYVYNRNDRHSFNLVAIINEEKANSFSNFRLLEDLVESTPNLSITDINIKNPNNPAQLKRAKLIKYFVQ